MTIQRQARTTFEERTSRTSKVFTAGFYGGVLEDKGFSALFTTNDASRSIVIVTLDELLTTAMPSQSGVRMKILPQSAAPIYKILASLGVNFAEIEKAITRIASSVAAYSRGDSIYAYGSVDEWRAHYQRSHKRQAPEPVRIGRPHQRDHLLTLRQNDDQRRHSFYRRQHLT